MGFVEIDDRPRRHDAAGVDGGVAAVVVVFDVIHVDGLGHPRDLVEVSGVAPEVGIVDDSPEVAFEVTDIDRVETDQGREEPPIGFGQGVADEVAVRPEAFFDGVQGVEESVTASS